MPILSTICPVCTESFQNGEDIYSTMCGHIFHLACLNQWRSRGTSCPQCRQYDPKSHKLYLSFEESDENLQELEVMRLKLQTTNDKITDILVQKNEAESNFMKLQEQFTISENSKRELEIQIMEINDYKNDFCRIQAQYTESSNLVKEMEDRLQQLFIENESISKELRLKTLENDSLTASLEALQNSTPESALISKIILEKKLNDMSKEFEKDINISKPDVQLQKSDSQIQNYVLSLEKKLKSSISLSNLNKEIEMRYLKQQDELHALKLEMKETAQIIESHKEEIRALRYGNTAIVMENRQLRETINTQQNEIQQLKESAKSFTTTPKARGLDQPLLNDVARDDPNANSVLVKGIMEQQLNIIPKIDIINMARIMNIRMSDRDIVKISKMERKFYERHNLKPNKVILIVQFRTPELKVDFLKNKEKLKLHQHFNDIEISDYVSDEVYNLYQYAKILKTSGYALIYWRNNCVYAKKTRSTLCEPILIKSKDDVDSLKMFKKI